MTSDVGIISSTPPSAIASVASAPVATSGSSTFSATVSATSASNLAPFHNPRIIDDPSAGIITEYLSSNGSQVISQTPNAVTVAYLHQGLTAQGLTKEQAQLIGRVTA